MVVTLAVILLFSGVYFAVKGLTGKEADLRRRIALQEEVLKQAQALIDEKNRLNAQPVQKKLTQPLMGYIESLAEKHALTSRLQMNMLPEKAVSGLQGVEVKVNDLTLDEMVNLVHTLESADPMLVIDQLELAAAFRDKDLLRLTMRVLAIK